MALPESARLSAKFTWVPVLTRGDRRPFSFGTKRTRLSGCQEAAVYRWIFYPLKSSPICLVGSTDDLYRRVAEYIAHSSKHHQGVRKTFEEHCSAGGSVHLEVLRFEPFWVNGAEFSEKRLLDPFVREALEKICCADLESQGFQLLNSNLLKRAARKVLRLANRSPAEFEALLEKLKASKI